MQRSEKFELCQTFFATFQSSQNDRNRLRCQFSSRHCCGLQCLRRHRFVVAPPCVAPSAPRAARPGWSQLGCPAAPLVALRHRRLHRLARCLSCVAFVRATPQPASVHQWVLQKVCAEVGPRAAPSAPQHAHAVGPCGYQCCFFLAARSCSLRWREAPPSAA